MRRGRAAAMATHKATASSGRRAIMVLSDRRREKRRKKKRGGRKRERTQRGCAHAAASESALAEGDSIGDYGLRHCNAHTQHARICCIHTSIRTYV